MYITEYLNVNANVKIDCLGIILLVGTGVMCVKFVL